MILAEGLSTMPLTGDAASGGIIRVYHMKPTGFEVISEQDCKDLHYMYAAEKK